MTALRRVTTPNAMPMRELELIPVCDQCGAITVRNGACYRCYNCGNSMGCS